MLRRSAIEAEGAAPPGLLARWDPYAINRPLLIRSSRLASSSLRACFKIVGGRRVRARGLREMAKILKPCRPGPLTGRFLKHVLSRKSLNSLAVGLGRGDPKDLYLIQP